MTTLATAGPSVFWYLARGSGLAALVVLTLSLVLGIVTTVRWSSPRWPRFVIELLHRNSSLLALALIAVHVCAVVIDAFAPIGWKDTVLPFASTYRPVWLGLGAAAFDILLALIVTSLLRHRMSHRTWRLVHWFAYLCWPLVVVHGLGTGSDTKVGFVLGLYAVCIAAVVVAAWWRLAVGWPDHAGVRAAGAVTSIVAPVVLVVWLASGPLAAGWASKAGTPASLLAGRSAGTPSATPTPTATTPTGLPAPPFSAQLRGAITESTAGGARVTDRVVATVSGAASGTLEVDITGAPVNGGGVVMQTSRVTLGPTGQAGQYQGQLVDLRGDVLVASVQSAAGRTLRLTIAIQPDASRQFTGTLDVAGGNP
jgi:DMSO/TMAO reductase YedYZ heme-binding membrane subunit